MPNNDTVSTRPTHITNTTEVNSSKAQYANVAQVTCARLNAMHVVRPQDCNDLHYSDVYDIMLSDDEHDKASIEAKHTSYHMCVGDNPYINPYVDVVTRYLYFYGDDLVAYNIREALLYSVGRDRRRIFNIIQNDKSIHLQSNFTARSTLAQYHDTLASVSKAYRIQDTDIYSAGNKYRHVHVYIGSNCSTYCTHVSFDSQTIGSIDLACALRANVTSVGTLPQIVDANANISVLQILLLMAAPTLSMLSCICTYIFGSHYSCIRH